MNPYAISPLLCSIFAILLGVFVFLKNTKSPVNRTFGLLCFETVNWQLSWSIPYFFLTTDLQRYFLVKFAWITVTLLPFTHYHFIVRFLKLEKELRWVWRAYFVAVIWLIILWTTDLFIAGYRQFNWGYYTKAGILHPVYLIFAALALTRTIVLLKRASHDPSLSVSLLNQTKFVFFSIGIYFLATVEYFINYGVDFYPIGVFFILSSFAIISYAIVRHQLMEIEVVIKKTLVFAGAFVFVFGVFVGITLLISQLFGAEQTISLVISAVLITTGLRPIETLLINATDKFLFQKKYEYKQILKTFIDEVITVLNFDEIVGSTLKLLSQTIHPYTSAVCILNKTEDKYQLYNSYGLEDRNIGFSSDSKLIAFLKQTHQPAVIRQIGGADGVSPEMAAEMAKLKAVMVLPLSLHNDLIGFISLGKKKSDEDYSKDDLDVLLDLARTESIAIGNAQLFQEAAQAERRAAIGTMSAGIHHEIGNPLNIINTKIQVFMTAIKRDVYKDKTKKELLQECGSILNETIRQTNRIAGITRKLSNFAKPGREFRPEIINIPEQIEEALAVLGHELELEKIQITREFSPELYRISADRQEIQQVFFNLIRNAAQAIEASGQINIRGFNIDNSRVRIEIQDTGKGIPQDKLSRIFEPFFTTKEPNKGTGLGLSIVRQLVWRNKGEISFRSQEAEGTTFILEFQRGLNSEKSSNSR